MESKIKDAYTDFLFECILELKDKEECYAFFEDLCTVPEVKSLAQRLQVAKMLTDGRVYKDIVSKTGASTATISRVNRSLRYGCNGYDKVFRRVSENSIGKKDE
ncbi:MAG: TrpR-like protein, YerC/YecD [Clostridiales bacterium]|nr:TrpR-like protein, YerC/YecD [Clostridiales bacterium]